MSYFRMFEDPMYDDDGQLCDEDVNEGDWEDDKEMVVEEQYGPYSTINS